MDGTLIFKRELVLGDIGSSSIGAAELVASDILLLTAVVTEQGAEVITVECVESSSPKRIVMGSELTLVAMGLHGSSEL